MVSILKTCEFLTFFEEFAHNYDDLDEKYSIADSVLIIFEVLKS